MLNEFILKEEIIKATETMKVGKAPGPDRFTAKYYRIFLKYLTPIFEIVFNEILKTKLMPKSWKEATISLIPKEDQDLTNVKNGRPISVLNNDYKVFARIISERIKFFKEILLGKNKLGFCLIDKLEII